jgi:RHS repeat-associated protein
VGQEQVHILMDNSAVTNYGLQANGIGDKHFELTNHLGNVLNVVTDRKLAVQNGTSGTVDYFTADVVSYSDYDPFGMLLPNRHEDESSYKYGFNGMLKDDEIKSLSGTSYDFGARMYDPRVGRFLSLDPRIKDYPAWSSYVFVRNNPILRIDPTGMWDVEVHVCKDREKYGYGIAIVKNRSGKEIFRYKVRVEGTGGRDRSVKNSDTPTGTYDIPDKDMWMSGGDRQAYGPNHRLVLNGESGEIKESGRGDIRIHGGRQETYNSELGKWEPSTNPELKKTHGCFRAFDSDVNKMKELTDGLQKNDSQEFGGKLKVIEDLMEVNGEYVIPAEIQPVEDIKQSVTPIEYLPKPEVKDELNIILNIPKIEIVIPKIAPKKTQTNKKKS